MRDVGGLSAWHCGWVVVYRCGCVDIKVYHIYHRYRGAFSEPSLVLGGVWYTNGRNGAECTEYVILKTRPSPVRHVEYFFIYISFIGTERVLCKKKKERKGKERVDSKANACSGDNPHSQSSRQGGEQSPPRTAQSWLFLLQVPSSGLSTLLSSSSLRACKARDDSSHLSPFVPIVWSSDFAYPRSTGLASPLSLSTSPHGACTSVLGWFTRFGVPLNCSHAEQQRNR